MQKTYKSFKEIDKELRILKLKKEIAIWTMKNESEQLKYSLAPKNLALNAISSLSRTRSTHGINWKVAIRNIIIAFVAKRIFRI
ncbi:hypothetical protein C7377_0861 [Balneicella halophila]|uniref:Uncharacterized protein n=1 Tax=Balneicella halophila TaxID=1537566 RepID=A0A7L4UT86_BALHA|nr:DUF6327 family protein [Balneicella halophila]PVX52537.1 hypothetical protein C7377_0861 [Balneicella halophila]